MRLEVGMLAVVAALGVACGGAATQASTPGVPVVAFPAKADVPPPSAGPVQLPTQLTAVEVQSFRIETTVPASREQYSLTTHFDGVLIESLRDSPTGTISPERAARLNPSLGCAARETARFYVETGGYPSDALRSFLLLRCGNTFTNVATAVWQAIVPDGVPEGQVEKEFDPNVRELLGRVASNETHEVGIGYARGKGRAAVVIYTGAARARIVDYTPVFQGVGVTFEVEVKEPVAVVTALANQGQLGVKACEPDAASKAPRFRFFCAIAANDSWSRVDIAVRGERAVLYDVVAQALFRRTEDAALTYEPVLFGADAVAADAAAFREALYGALNDARKAAGVSPLVIEARQAAWNDRMSSSYYRAIAQNDVKLREQSALAMLAGWDVDGAIRDAGFFSGILPNERRPARWLAAGLESPFGRWVLLEKSASRVAVGTAELTTPGIAALVTTYSLFDGASHELDQKNLRALLTAKRSALGKQAPTFREPSKALRSALARIEREGVSALSALSDVVTELREDGEMVNGYAVETIDLRVMSWVGELLGPDTLDVEIGVTHYKPNGAAWGQYAVLFVIRPTGPSEVASNW